MISTARASPELTLFQPLDRTDHKPAITWHALPNELKIKVMRQLVPSSVSITSHGSQPGEVIPHSDKEPWASRQALAAVCLASKQLESICRPLLYEAIALRNCRELLCLLRSLVKHPRLRAQVRRFAWSNLIRDVDVNQPMILMGPELEALVSECCSVWPATRRDRTLAELFQLRATEPATFCLWKIIGVVIATLPRLQVLFLTHGGLYPDSLGLGYSAEHDAITHLLSPALMRGSAIWYTVKRRDIDRRDRSGSSSRIHRRNPRSLRMLEEIILDSCDIAVDYAAAEIQTPWTLWFLILNCPRLRRVELKGPIRFNAILDPRVWATNNPNQATIQFHAPPNLLLLPQPVGHQVRELVMHRLHVAHWDALPRIFPNVERLVAVFQDNKWRQHPWRSSIPPGIPPNVLPPDLGRSITLYRDSLRSLTVSGCLSNNGITYKGNTNNAELGHRWLVSRIPPLLSPGLPQVPLTELTTDCVWLFGHKDPSVAYRIPSLLPSSLVSLHLIDYWAVPVDEEVVEGGEALGYYPTFPSGLTPLGFLDKVFAILRESCTVEHASLKRITLSSPLFDEDGRWSTPGTRPVDRAAVRAWQAGAGGAFSRLGVSFTFTTMMDLESKIKSSWARM